MAAANVGAGAPPNGKKVPYAAAILGPPLGYADHQSRDALEGARVASSPIEAAGLTGREAPEARTSAATRRRRAASVAGRVERDRGRYPPDKCVHELFEAQVARRPMPSRSSTKCTAHLRANSTRAPTASHTICAPSACGPMTGWRSASSAASRWWWACSPCSRPAAPMCRWIRVIRPSGWPTCSRTARRSPS